MTTLSITAGPYSFRAHLEEERAPKTCEAFSKLLRASWTSAVSSRCSAVATPARFSPT